MTHLTTLDELKQNITLLACIEETDAPFISCYLNREDGQDRWRYVLDERAHILRRILKGDDLANLEDALGRIEGWLAHELLPKAKGMAIFARGTAGGGFMLPMQFAEPLPNWIAVYPTPNIYHLVELKDDYHRYVILLALPDRVFMLEVNIGPITIQAWINEPNLRKRVEWEWNRPLYQLHQADRGDQFVRRKIALLEQLMLSGGHTHLIVAGDPEITRHVLDALPDTLADKLVGTFPSDGTDQLVDVVMETLTSLIEHKKQESLTIVERLIEGLRSQNLAVAGLEATVNALRWGEVDVLVMINDYQPDPGWTCNVCKSIGSEVPITSACPRCGEKSVRPLDIKEALLRLAGQRQCPVEVVAQSDVLMSLGGVGCLLRIHVTTQTAPAAALDNASELRLSAATL